MTDAPVRICIRTWQDGSKQATTHRQSNYPSLIGYTDIEYRRADQPPTVAEALAVPEVQALVDALRPLAQMADHYDPEEDNGHLECWSRAHTPRILHLRVARAALARLRNGGTGSEGPET